MPLSDKAFEVFMQGQQQPPLFFQLIKPNGGLTQARETHALFYYYIIARSAYEEVVKGTTVVYEGDDDPSMNLRQTFISVAKLYKVAPEAMAKCWSHVDITCAMLSLPMLPDERRYRLDFKPERILH